MLFLFAASVVTFGLAAVQPNNEVITNIANEPGKHQQDFFNFFESIGKNDLKQKGIYRSILEGETRREQQAFDSMKDEWRSARFRSGKQRQSHAALKREAKVTSAKMPDAGTTRLARNAAPQAADGSKQTAVERTLDELGYRKSWSELNNDEKAMAFSTLVEKLNREKALNNKISVVFYFRVRIDRLEAILVQDEDVKEELRRLDAMKFTVTVPEEVEPDGKSSFKGRYRVWFAIGNVMADDRKNDGFMVKARKIFKEVGVDTKDPKQFAGDTAMLFNKLSGEVKKDSADEVDWKNEEEVIAALKSWRKLQDEDQINIARAIYRLFR